MMFHRPALGAFGLFILLFSTGLHAIERISVPQAGGEANNHSQVWDITPDGRYVVIRSEASNLVPDDTNGQSDIFRIDRNDGSIVRVSVDSDENETTDTSHGVEVTISNDGNLVCFDSNSAQLVDDDTNGSKDVFVRDIENGTTTRVSLDVDGEELATGIDSGLDANVAISGNGKVVVFKSSDTKVVEDDLNGVSDIFLRELGVTTLRVSVTNAGSEAMGASHSASISDDGMRIAFVSDAENLVGDDDNGVADVFVRHLDAGGSTTRVSLADGGTTQATNISSDAAISGDGKTVAFISRASNLVAGDTNSINDLFVREVTGTSTEVISVATGSSTFVTDGSIRGITISPTGRYVGFLHQTAGLYSGTIPNSFTGYLRDRQTAKTLFINQTETGVQGSEAGDAAESTASLPLSLETGVLVFHTRADNLVPGDENDALDVFVRDFDPPASALSDPGVDNSALIGLLKKKLKKLKKKQKSAKRAGKIAKAKRFNKKIKKVKKQLKML